MSGGRVRGPQAVSLLLAFAGFAVGLSGCLEVDLDESSAPSQASAEAESPPASSAGWFLEPAQWDPEQPPALSHEPPFALEGGSLPSKEEAQGFPNAYNSFRAVGTDGLDDLRAEGYLAGDGTPEDPYVLDRFYVENDLTIESTNRSLIVREGYVGGQLTLNYVGASVYVHHVYARDLRINENVARDGLNTGGLWEQNRFGFVGQIRHFIGEFRGNEIGPRPQGAFEQAVGDAGLFTVAPSIVFNFDGFHGADVHDNVFVGAVDIKLHGHNHGDCFTCPVHDHHDPAEFPGNETNPHTHSGDEVADALGFRSRHSVRYHSLAFHDNEIRVDGDWALRYKDTNHAGDDRTANSEPNEHLDDPHLHFQDVTLARNRLVGGGLVVQIFNAGDDHHPVQNRGILRILANEVGARYGDEALLGFGARQVDGVRVVQADGLELRLEDNVVRFDKVSGATPGLGSLPVFGHEYELVGIRFDDVSAANLTIRTTVVASGDYGVYAARLGETVWWKLLENTFDTDVAWRGHDVENPPEEG